MAALYFSISTWFVKAGNRLATYLKTLKYKISFDLINCHSCIVFMHCKMARVKPDKLKKKKLKWLYLPAGVTSLRPPSRAGDNITGVNHRVVVWVPTDITAWSDLASRKRSNTPNSINVNPLFHSLKVMRPWNEILRRTTKKIATNLPPGYDDISCGGESLPSWLAQCLSSSDFATGATGLVCVLHWF